MNLIVDLNADLGEGSGHDEELFELISSANVATGFHAGDSEIDHAAVHAERYTKRSRRRCASKFLRPREFRTKRDQS